MKSKKIGVVALLALAVAAPSAAEAAVRLKVAQAISGDAEQEASSDGFGNDFTQSGDYTPTALNLAFISDTGAYFDIGYSTSSDDASLAGGGDYDYERTDLTLTVGGVKNGLGGYVGFKTGEGKSTSQAGLGEDTLSATGVVAGLSGQFKPAPKHTIAVTGGIGFMGGEWEMNYGSPLTIDFDWTLGFSWGLAYSFQAAEKVAVGIEHKAQSYDFEWVDDGTIGFDQDMNESLSSTNLFLSFVF